MIKKNQDKKLLDILIKHKILEEAEAFAYAIVNIKESMDKIYDEILPKIINADLSKFELQDLIWDIREEFRHIDYHIKDGKLLDL